MIFFFLRSYILPYHIGIYVEISLCGSGHLLFLSSTTTHSFTMRLVIATAAAATLAGAAPVSDAVESLFELTTEQVSNFEVATLGGMTLRADQVYNEKFMGAGRGPRAYVQSLRKFSQFGATIDPSLQCIVESILQELGLGGATGSSNCAATPGTGAGTGTGTGSGTGTRPTGTRPTGTRPTSTRPTATRSTSRPTATGRPAGANGTNPTGK